MGKNGIKVLKWAKDVLAPDQVTHIDNQNDLRIREQYPLDKLKDAPDDELRNAIEASSSGPALRWIPLGPVSAHACLA